VRGSRAVGGYPRRPVTDAPAVVVPSYEGAHLLARLLPSLATQSLRPTVVVVDNGSTDGTAELLAEHFAEVHRIALPENAGFARAVNRGVAATDASTVLVVNNDVVCEPEFVERLCEALDPSNGFVMAAGVLLHAVDPGVIDTAGVMFDRTLFAVDHLHGLPVAALAAAPDPLGPTGGAAAYDRAAFDAVRGFDERFFAYLEDVDLTARLLARGGRCRLARDARAHHRHSATLGSGSARKNALMGWSRGYTLGKYRLHRRPGLFARAVLGESVIATGQAVVDRTFSGWPARVAGFRDGLRAPAEPLPPLPASAARLTLADGLRYRLSRRAPVVSREPGDHAPLEPAADDRARELGNDR
jgi:GT2 family glycosyltransferase